MAFPLNLVGQPEVTGAAGFADAEHRACATSGREHHGDSHSDHHSDPQRIVGSDTSVGMDPQCHTV